MSVTFDPDRGAMVRNLVMPAVDATPSRVHALANEIRNAMSGKPRETRTFVWGASYCRDRHGWTAMCIPGPMHGFKWSVSSFNRPGHLPHLGIGCVSNAGHHVGAVGVGVVRFWRILNPPEHLGYRLVIEGRLYDTDATMVVDIGGLTPRPSRWGGGRQPTIVVG